MDEGIQDAIAHIRRLEAEVKTLKRDLASTRALLDETARNEVRLQYTLAYMQKKVKDAEQR